MIYRKAMNEKIQKWMSNKTFKELDSVWALKSMKEFSFDDQKKKSLILAFFCFPDKIK